MSDTLIPTLVIGVGGIGCQIAESLFSDAQRHGYVESGQVAVIGFDTDRHDVRRRERVVGRRGVVQFSTADSVRSILAAHTGSGRRLVPEPERSARRLQKYVLVRRRRSGPAADAAGVA